jgi:3-hydroxybutyryl-CoA dehydrogenase
MKRIGVVGGGLMGAGIAEVCARSSLEVLVHEVDDVSLSAARERIHRSLARAVTTGRIEEDASHRAFERISFTSDLDCLADRELVIEAVTEDESVKIDLFTRLDRVLVDENAILASNTSSIPIMKLAMATRRPEQVLGIHFFNPVPVLRLVELVSSLLTSQEAVDGARMFARDRLGKEVIHSKDRAGFIVNALLIPYLLSAIRMLESGFASAEDIDTGMIEGCAHPMGPLSLADLIGLDTTEAVAQSLYDEFKEPLYAPPPLLSRMKEAGLLGRKSGQGFFSYAG